MHLTHKKQKGSIIAFSLLLLSILLTAGLSVITVAALEKRSGLATQKSTIAFQAADSGTERVLKKIYIDNSPALTQVALNGTMPDATLTNVATALDNVTSATCDTSTNQVTATNDVSPSYSFNISFLDGSDVVIACNDNQWRDKLVKIRAEGFFRQTSRVIELGIKPRPKCATTDTIDYGGETYGVVNIGDQCWMNRNLNIGTMIPGVTPQINDGSIQKYCYSDVASNCTSNHPNRPDGGLYTWDEAMGYTTNEGAQGICPSGWHIPSDADWYYLEHFIDPTINDPSASSWRGTDAGTKLKPAGTSGFEFNYTGSWLKSSGPAFFAGRGGNINDWGYLWSSSYITQPGFTDNFYVFREVAQDFRFDAQISRSNRAVNGSGQVVTDAFPVRCVAD